MDSPRDRPSGIPRLSRLPVPRTIIETSSSRDGFNGAGLELLKLRQVTSRNRLRPSVNGSSGRDKALCTTHSRDQLSKRASSALKKPDGSSSPAETETDAAIGQAIEQRPKAAESHEPSLVGNSVRHDVPATTDTPRSWTPESTTGDGRTFATEDDATAIIIQTPATRKTQPRPSLSERTVKTLAQIPPSPALRQKSSSFFERERPRSRVEMGNSRPPSRHVSDRSVRTLSRQGSRPASSAGQNSGLETSFCGPGRPSDSSQAAMNGTPPRGSIPLASATILHASCHPPVPDTRQDFSSKKTPIAISAVKPASRTTVAPTTARSAKARAPCKSLGLVNRPSLTSIKSSKDQRVSEAVRDGAMASTLCSPGPAMNGAASLANRKSSAALREQIAQAKAAKRAAAQKSSSNPGLAACGDVSSRSHDARGPNHDLDDPFNVRKWEQPTTKVLQQRLRSARTTGRLNIAALGLKVMPREVMNMYSLEAVNSYGGDWAESVDMTRLVAADNEIEAFAESIFPDRFRDAVGETEGEDNVNIFGALETIDLHGNLLANVPLGFRSLGHLTSLNLSSNRLGNGSWDVISQMPSLRDLKLSNNRLSGPLDSAMLRLCALEILDVHGNSISALPPGMEGMVRLRVLNLDENQIEALPFASLAQLPLAELSVRRNRLCGALIEDPIESLACLQTLDASANQLTHFVPPDSRVSLPVVSCVSLSVNRLQCLPDMSSWKSLLTLTADENHIANIPDSFTSLDKLRHADLASNDIRTVPPEIARMQGLLTLRLNGNPLRDRKLVSAATDELKAILAARLEALTCHGQQQQPNDKLKVKGRAGSGAGMGDKTRDSPNLSSLITQDGDLESDEEEEFATPPTSAPQTPTRRVFGKGDGHEWIVRPDGLLDLSRPDMTSLSAEKCSSVASQVQVRRIQLHYTLLASIPTALDSFGLTLTSLSISHSHLSSDSYLAETLELPALRELALVSNRIASLDPLTHFLQSPALEKLDVMLNRITLLPDNLRQAFPKLSTLVVSSNQLVELSPESIKGMKMVDASSNDIAHLEPRIGLLGGVGGLRRLEVTGNRFKVPRWSILERGTEATLRWLRGRLPVEVMEEWRSANGEDGGDAA